MTILTAAPTTIEIPVCEPGLGSLVSSPSSPMLIEGVSLSASSLWPDDRGWFQEVFRFGQGLVRDYPPHTTQVSAAVSHPGVVKAFHYHRNQTDFWVPVTGLFQVSLVDLRPDSPTFARKNTLYIGEQRPWQILIPPGVAHGYKVVSPSSGVLVYATDRFYDPADEGRIPYNDPCLAYDWATQHK